MTDIRAEAQAEAERRWPNEIGWQFQDRPKREAFISGAEWRGAEVEKLRKTLAEARCLTKALGFTSDMAGTMGDLARALASPEETDAAEEYADRICVSCGSLRPFHETTCPGWTAPVEAHWRDHQS